MRPTKLCSSGSARATAVRERGKARSHLPGFLFRLGRLFVVKTGWTRPTALARQGAFRSAGSADPVASLYPTVTGAEARIERLTRQFLDLIPQWPF